MLLQLSMSGDALYEHAQRRIAMQIVAEREAAERAAKCGTVAADLSGLEDALAARLEAIR
jgi:hypothetical protein